ncbi:MAG: hypothetical protein RJB24_61 [Candidatus Parcubacteria bacterium]|jgi:hypothetical protein
MIPKYDKLSSLGGGVTVGDGGGNEQIKFVLDAGLTLS